MSGSKFVNHEGEPGLRIEAPHRMAPFFLSIPGESDVWLFVSSRGGLTAGRVDADGALFPYETVDRLHHAHTHTGPITRFRIRRPGGPDLLWDPFADEPDPGAVERSLWKNTVGNRLVFGERHRSLGLSFHARWSSCDRFGLVRTAVLVNEADTPARVSLLDGLRDLLPFGAPLGLYQQASSLVDAYKQVDVDPATGLALVSLTSRIVDRPEAAEELRANTVWVAGLPGARVRLSGDTPERFGRGEDPPAESRANGGRAHVFVLRELDLAPGESVRWHLVADAGRGPLEIGGLRAFLAGPTDRVREVDEELDRARDALVRNVASADGLQAGDPTTATHHFANVLFNNMRGGVFVDGVTAPRDDVRAFLRTRNRPVAERHADWLDALPETLPAPELVERAAATGDPHLERLAREYLPLHFGRRHGDPSRPWNRFTIRLRNPDGSDALRYEGNWRDIFQNWEALAVSFPAFLPGFAAKFVNASTRDGFNPYRITREGIDWEIPDPEDPWSHIGYWGDHQIIYLLKFLEALEHHDPAALRDLLDRRIFSYADVPYRIAPYADLLRDPHDTIAFDTDLQERIETRCEERGTDGRLVPGADGEVLHVTLAEKLLVPALAKLGNLVPGGGIWMNTQRPEWNDANNALVGYGLSVVTLAYLRRYLAFLADLLESGPAEARVSPEVATWLRDTARALADERSGGSPDDPESRRRFLDAVGEAYARYRERVYSTVAPGEERIPAGEFVAFCRDAVVVLDRSLAACRRPDGLFHAYQLLDARPEGSTAGVEALHLMLEGQVAALSSGAVTPADAVGILDTMFASGLYREDQRSFLLYPVRDLPPFLERNVVPEAAAESVPLLAALLAEEDRSLLLRDAGGVLRFAGDVHNAADVTSRLDALAWRPGWRERVEADRAAVLGVFESVFHHRSYTGRSGTMYGYEGIGCIYWHMVAKLLLAVQELALRADAGDGDPAIRDALFRHYHRIRDGLGFRRSPEEYGAFPTDPYSHTPPDGVARQPGMTGQVKEEILTRFGELGVAMDDGRLGFRPRLLRADELSRGPEGFRYVGSDGVFREIPLPAGSVAFTLAGVPVVYVAGETGIRVHGADGTVAAIPGDALDRDTTADLLSRAGRIERLEVGISADGLFREDG